MLGLGLLLTGTFRLASLACTGTSLDQARSVLTSGYVAEDVGTSDFWKVWQHYDVSRVHCRGPDLVVAVALLEAGARRGVLHHLVNIHRHQRPQPRGKRRCPREWLMLPLIRFICSFLLLLLFVVVVLLLLLFYLLL